MRLALFSIISVLVVPILGLGCYSKGITFNELIPNMDKDILYWEIDRMCALIVGDYKGYEEKATCRNFGANSVIMSAQFKGPKDSLPEKLSLTGCSFVTRKTYDRCGYGGVFRPHPYSYLDIRVDPQEGRCV